MIQFCIGIGFILFGLLVGGVGLASAGVGIGIPMIPIGAYIAFRGGRIIQNEKINQSRSEPERLPLKVFERTKTGKTGLGIILLLVGVGTSAFLIGIPIAIVGLWLLYSVWGSEVKALLKKKNRPDA